MKQMFDKRELALSSTSDEGLRIKTYGFKDLYKLLDGDKLYVDESIDVLNLNLLEEEKDKEKIAPIIINLESKSTIVNLYASGNVGQIDFSFSDISTYHDYYILNGFNGNYNTLINGISSVDGFFISFNLAGLASLPDNNALIRINPKMTKFENIEKIKYDYYLYDVSLYGQHEV